MQQQQPLKKLLDQVREAIRLKHYSYRTQESYLCFYILFRNKQHPKVIYVVRGDRSSHRLLRYHQQE